MDKYKLTSIIIRAILAILIIISLFVYINLTSQINSLQEQNTQLESQIIDSNSQISNLEAESLYYKGETSNICLTGLCKDKLKGSSFNCDQDGSFNVNGVYGCTCDPGCGISINLNWFIQEADFNIS